MRSRVYEDEMKLLKKRKNAVLITIVVVIAATLYGVYTTEGRYSRDIEAMFFDGVFLEEQGFTQPSINSHLEKSANAALGLATLMENYPGLAGRADALLSARRELLAAGNITQKERAALKMRDGFIDLLNAAKKMDLTEREIDSATQFYSTFNGAMIAINNSRYNEIVGDHLDSQCSILRQISKILPANQPHSFIAAPFDSTEFSWS